MKDKIYNKNMIVKMAHIALNLTFFPNFKNLIIRYLANKQNGPQNGVQH
jgi:hypothetical protein